MKFSLRDLIMFTMIAGVLFAWMMERHNRDLDRSRLLKDLETLKGDYENRERVLSNREAELKLEMERLRREEVRMLHAAEGALAY